MNDRIHALRIGLLVLGLFGGVARGQKEESVRVVAQASKGPYYVGQEIQVEVSVDAEGGEAEVVFPKVAAAEVTPVDARPKTVGSTATPASGPGRVKTRTSSRFWVLPRRSGRLVIPPVSARLGERSASSRPLRLEIKDVPLAGRPAEFLGGVGEFRVEAEASLVAVRAGQSFVYRIRVSGPAARGMSRAPDLSRLERVPLGLTIQREPEEVVDYPPSRVFCYRMRPTRAGEAVLPPVVIAAFDPATRRYVTKATTGVRVRVDDVPRYDPATLAYGPPASGQSSRMLGGVVAVVAGLSAVAGVWFATRKARGRRRSERALRRLMARIEAGLDGTEEPHEVGRRITEGLVEYLNVMAGRPKGALTPDEAHQGIGFVTGDEALGEFAGRLVARCDRAQFAGEGAAAELVDEARRLFGALGQVPRGQGREGEGPEIPREAVEAAPS